jgi:hypothetical protein
LGTKPRTKHLGVGGGATLATVSVRGAVVPSQRRRGARKRRVSGPTLLGRPISNGAPSAIVSDPGADAQQTHKDQPSVAGDSAADSAGIVLVALSDGGCTIDAVVVDWEQRTPTGPEAEPHAVFASNQGDIVMLRHDLSHRGAANPGAEQNYRLHFHLDTPATCRGRTSGWNHYPVA